LKAAPSGRAALLLAWVLVSLGCPNPGPSEPPPDRVDEPEPEPGTTSTGAPEPGADEGSSTSVVVVEPAGGSCEGVCGDLHDCLLAEPDSSTSHSQAAALELDCLRQCVETGPAVSDSRFAACADAPECGELLSCMREAWPDEPSNPLPEPEIGPSGTGCRIGCERLGKCFDAKAEEIDTCTSGCEQKLDLAQMKGFGECVAITDCAAMLECMIAFPGAGPGSGGP
jgi:hypothetical protein